MTRAGWLLVGATIVLGTSIATAAVVRQDAPKPTADPAILSDEELEKVGDTTVNETCGNRCHGLEHLEMRRTVDDWNSEVRQMIDRGVMASERDLAIVKQYLKRYYGLVAVNTARAEEFSLVLGLSPKDAQAIVEYRTAQGKFADAAALAKVPGIDKTKIDEQPDALRFR